jgi:hypothetical protein
MNIIAKPMYFLYKKIHRPSKQSNRRFIFRPSFLIKSFLFSICFNPTLITII